MAGGGERTDGGVEREESGGDEGVGYVGGLGDVCVELASGGDGWWRSGGGGYGFE